MTVDDDDVSQSGVRTLCRPAVVLVNVSIPSSIHFVNHPNPLVR